jgi:hypothetical protein
VQGGGGPVARPSLADGLRQQAQMVQFGGAPGEVSGGSPSRGQNRNRGGGGFGKAASPEGIADELHAWAESELGLKGGSRDRTVAGNRAVGGSGDSDHLEERGAFKGREALDLPTTPETGGWAQYRKVVRQLGGKPNANGFTEFTIRRGEKLFRVQAIFGAEHDHKDHIHVGFRRIA